MRGGQRLLDAGASPAEIRDRVRALREVARASGSVRMDDLGFLLDLATPDRDASAEQVTELALAILTSDDWQLLLPADEGPASRAAPANPVPDEDLFASRPLLEEPCRACRGTGVRLGSYALHAASRGMALEDEVPAGAVRAFVVGSSSIFEACREAAEVAGRAGRPVAFMFNDLLVVIKPGDDPDLAARTWWQLAHGETPEQTWERR